jgi:hypothetical protein
MVDADAPVTEVVPDQPPGSRPIRRIALIGVAGLAAVLLVIGILYGPTMWQVFQQRNTTISTPTQVAGLELDQSDDAKSTAEYIRDAVATSTSLSKSVGGVYTTPGDKTHSVMLVGGSATLWSPDDVLNDVFKLITDDTGGVRDVRDIPPGELGGVMRCGTTATQDGDMPVCGWADHGCLAVALFPGRTLDDAEKLMREFRPAVQRRN